MAKRRVTESLTGPVSGEDLSPFAIPYGSAAQRATGRKTMVVRKGDRPRQLAPKPTARDYAATLGSMASSAMRPGQMGFEVGARLRPAIPAIAAAAKDYLTQTPLAQMGSDVLGGLRSAGEYALGDTANAIADLSRVGAGRDFLKDVERAASLRARGDEGGAYGIEQLAPLMLAAGIVPGGGAAMREGERAALRAAEEGASGLAARAVPITTRELPLGQRMYATPEGAQLTVMENAKFAPRQHSVTDFVVPEELRGQGRGAALLDEVLGRYDPMQISAAASSPASAALFHKRGFRPVGEPEADLERALQIMRDDSSVTMAVPPSGLVAYHGSPHTFDRFDISKIGTGEGAQAYGHGLYFAEAEPVAAEYRQRLAEVSAEPFDTIGIPPREWNAALMFARQMDPTQPHAAARDFAQWVGREVTPELVGAFKVARKPGSMYRVNLAVRPEDMLNWDRPLAEQSDAVQRASLAAAQSADLSHLKPGSRPRVRLDRFMEGNEQFHDRLRGLDLLMALDQTPGNNFSPQTSEILSEAGIPGISYLDRASRDVGEGTRNYVMFSDKPVSILKRYKKGGLSVKRKKAA